MFFKKFNCILIIFTFTILQGKCQWDGNTPPLMSFNRNWTIDENRPVGSTITTIEAHDSEGDPLVYDIEPVTPDNEFPFRIDNSTGTVYLTKSLQGRAGKNFIIRVSAFDGQITSKIDVLVNIAGPKTKARNEQLKPPSNPFSSFTSFNSGQPPASIANNPHPYIHNYRPQTPKTPDSVQLLPVSNYERETTTAHLESTTKLLPKIDVSENTNTSEKKDFQPIDKSESVSSAMLISVISLSMVFFGFGVIVLIFLKKFSFGHTKKSKEDVIKQTSGDIGLRQEQNLTMQYWRGPQAFNNRYVPWDGESLHSQATMQISAPLKTHDRWEFPRHRLKVFDIIGEGAFGQVWRCEAMDIDSKGGIATVAVKTLKENANEKERQDILSELKIMKMLEPHPNVVKLLGCCTEKDPIFVIMEFIGKGKLQSYLRSSRAERNYNNTHGLSNTLTSRDLTSFVYQVAKGMNFLSNNGIIHRDLAARNVLITEDHTCKVADFGFARDVIDSHVYERKSEGRLPIRWMAPESLYDNLFSVKSDVWSFGVLIWEVVTLGSTPYTGLSAAEVMKKIKEGYRLEKPEHCRRELYNIMYYCWSNDPKQRPSFVECLELLEKLIVSETDYIELERFPDHSYYNMTGLSGEKL